jgi:prephenate dehydrogenase
MQRLAIAGVGLIGGSFALALREAGVPVHVSGIDLGRSLAVALERGVIDEVLPLEEACGQADVVYLALPISQILELLPRVAAACRPVSLVTDAGSTKSEIVRRSSDVFVRTQFLGGHPMAGKETRGVVVADAGLFRGRPYILTPSRPADIETPAAKSFLSWIEAIGARPCVLSPKQHDETVALTSHLPQMLATSLASLLDQQQSRAGLLHAAGPGLFDSTRLALSPWGVWADILATNSDAIDAALAAQAAHLDQLRQELKRNGDLQHYFEAGRRFAEDLRKNNT